MSKLNSHYGMHAAMFRYPTILFMGKGMSAEVYDGDLTADSLREFLVERVGEVCCVSVSAETSVIGWNPNRLKFAT